MMTPTTASRVSVFRFSVLYERHKMHFGAPAVVVSRSAPTNAAHTLNAHRSPRPTLRCDLRVPNRMGSANASAQPVIVL